MTDLTKKQYLLSVCRRHLPQMQEHEIGSYFLYLHPQLRYVKVQAKSGKMLWLLGYAFCTDEEGKCPADDLKAWDGEDLLQITQFWTGRWALVSEDSLVTDACGLMGAFYWQEGESWCISSSLALLCQVGGKKTGEPVGERGINWQLLPKTRARGVCLPLCTQKLILGEKLKVVPHLWMTDQTSLSGEEKCSLVAQYLVNGVKNTSRFSGKELCVALTGGKDSRLVLAAFLKAGTSFKSYTAQHDNISSSDKRIPAQLAKRFGFLHSYLKMNPADAALLKDYDCFTAGNSNGADRQFYARGQFRQLGDVLIIRGGLFEAGQTYARGYAGDTPETFASGMRGRYLALTEDKAQAEAFQQWLDNAESTPIPFIDIRDRFYIEQRVGGWAAAIEQSIDMNDFVSVQLANCAALLSILLSADEQQRQKMLLPYGTIQQLKPELLDFEVNKRTFADRLRLLRNALRHPLEKLKALSGRYGR